MYRSHSHGKSQHKHLSKQQQQHQDHDESTIAPRTTSNSSTTSAFDALAFKSIQPSTDNVVLKPVDIGGIGISTSEIDRETKDSGGQNLEIKLKKGSNHHEETKRSSKSSTSSSSSFWTDYNISMIVYAIGSYWWIVASALVYLGPGIVWTADRIAASCVDAAIGYRCSSIAASISVLGLSRNYGQQQGEGHGEGSLVEDFNNGTNNGHNDCNININSNSNNTVGALEEFGNSDCVPDPSSSDSSDETTPVMLWRRVFWGLVFLPSLWVFCYGSYKGISHARNRLFEHENGDGHGDHGNDDDERSPSLSEWIGILVMSSAMPAGTAGMVSMGVYVFGTVAKHSPLWSAEILLPSTGSSKDAVGVHGTASRSDGHANLMRDALRLHQWAGYMSFFWFLLHTVLYCLIYGWSGVVNHFKPEIAQATASAAADEKSSEASTTTTGEYLKIFFVSMWEAIDPPPECRPILGWSKDKEDANANKNGSSDGHRYLFRLLAEEEDESSQHARSFCYGYYRNFNGAIAILAFSLLVLSSLAVVRRRNYRLFYVSHLLSATVFVLTMVFHMKRIVIYLMPSLLLYFSTTIPTLVQAAVCAVRDGGVRIEDYRVLQSSLTSSSLSSENITDKNCGCAELTFSLDKATSMAVASSKYDDSRAGVITHRPKSVKICVPSISLLWYPFTIIETNSEARVCRVRGNDGNENRTNNDDHDNHDDGMIQYTILFGTVGYFTKTLWKRMKNVEDFSKAIKESDSSSTVNDYGDNEVDEFIDEDEDVVQNLQLEASRCKMPLILVDGIYSGASDWIKSALTHDTVVIAAGGTGVTPFLTFVPKLIRVLTQTISAVSSGTMENLGIEGGVSGSLDSSSPDFSSETSQETTGSLSLKTVSFIWCCRDEALIRHVLQTYFLPLFRAQQHQLKLLESGNSLQSDGPNNPFGVRFQLMIYNTSRDRSDENPFDPFAANDENDVSSRRCGSSARSSSMVASGVPMRPSKLQYSPSSSRPTIVFGAVSFLSIALVGMAMHHRASDYMLTERSMFSIRAYGIYAVIVWSIVVGFATEILWRCWFFHSPAAWYLNKGYGVAGGHDRDHESNLSADHNEDNHNENDCWENGRTQELDSEKLYSRAGIGIGSLLPGKFYREEMIVPQTPGSFLELSIINGRPIFDDDVKHEHDDADHDDIERESESPSPSAASASMRRVVQADRPGVFYCGPDRLLETIKSKVNTDRRLERRKRRSSGNNNTKDFPNCVFYEESFEM